jgi:lysine 2,3-aminomutase
MPARPALTTVAALRAAGLVSARPDPRLDAVAARYAVAVTPDMAALIDPANATDPIALQFLPDARELDLRPEERADPIADGAFSPVPGIVHRYTDRVLLKPLHACPVYCRFCFRREMVGPGGDALDTAALDRALDYVAAHPEIMEVIVTGGDPFLLSPRRVARIVARLAALPHVSVVRWHTRVPVVDPARVTPELVAALRTEGLASWVGVHVNHARELTSQARDALARLADGGLPLVAQTVLLRGVNDRVETLEALFRALVASRVKPYYLHHPDLAPGTRHFRLGIDEGRALMRALRGRLSGLALPTYVLDVPDGAGKVPLGPDHWRDGAVETVAGNIVHVPDSRA